MKGDGSVRNRRRPNKCNRHAPLTYLPFEVDLSSSFTVKDLSMLLCLDGFYHVR